MEEAEAEEGVPPSEAEPEVEPEANPKTEPEPVEPEPEPKQQAKAPEPIDGAEEPQAKASDTEEPEPAAEPAAEAKASGAGRADGGSEPAAEAKASGTEVGAGGGEPVTAAPASPRPPPDPFAELSPEQVRTPEGRAQLADCASAHTGARELEDAAFERLADTMQACLGSALEQGDASRMAVFVDVVDTYTNAAAGALSSDARIRGSKIWASVEFWEGAVPAMAAEARDARAAAAGPGQAPASDDKHAGREVHAAVQHMLDFGNVSVPAVEKFVVSMRGRKVRLTKANANKVQHEIAKHEYRQLQEDIARTSSDAAGSDELGHDDLGFLIEHPVLHAASVEYEASVAEAAAEHKLQWDTWLEGDCTGESDDMRRRGIPVDLRSDVYTRLLAKAVEDVKSEGATYQQLLAKAKQELGSDAKEDIEKDLDRTFPGHTYIDTPGGKEALRNTLTAYAAHNPELGYCQSMNYICALLLVVMQADKNKGGEERAFWIFTAIENSIVPKYHTHGLMGCRVDSRVLFSLVERHLPDLHSHLASMGVVPEISFLSWFMCLFVNTLPVKTALRVWDCLLVEGPDVLLRVGFAVLQMKERVLRLADNSFNMNQTLQAAPKRIDDAERLIQTAYRQKWAGEVSQLREQHLEELLQEEMRINELRQERTDEQAFSGQFIQGHDGPEKLVHNGGGVLLRLANAEIIRGTVLVTSFRLVVVPRGSTVTEPVAIPLMSIQRADPAEGGVRAGNGIVFQAPSLEIVSKCGRSLLLIFDMDLMELLRMVEGDDGGDSKPPVRTAAELRSKVRKRATGARHPHMETKLQELLGCIRQQIDSATEAAPFMRKPEAFDADGLGAYDAEKEFERQGALGEQSHWRKTALNESYELCPTYPSVLLVPASVDDGLLQEVAKFRSKQRLPALSWFNKETQAAIVRCAQPLVGLGGKKSQADEELFDEIIKANPQNRGIAMLDARPKVNAVANKGKGGGYENIDRYDAGSATLLFLDIDNIHVMRASINEMHDLVISEDRSDPIRRSEVQLGWISHVGKVLGGAATIVREVGDKKRTALVHCSDGWDRTAQLCALAEICMDPYYRTVEGFQVVCQREWLSFGHKFEDRLWGHKLKERSPVFLQFLDCIHQMVAEYPTAFEFNQSMLLFVVDAMYSLEFQEFRYNCERLRTEAGQAGVSSMWRLARGDEYRNPDFSEHAAMLRPPVRARVWTQYFNRWIVDPIAGRLPSTSEEPAPRGVDGGSWTLETLMSEEPGAVIHAAPLMFRESEPVKEGWVFHRVQARTKVGHSAKLRWLVLHPSVDGEACLVFYEKEKSESTIPREVIPLIDGGFQVRLMPKRSKGMGKGCFQIRHKAQQAAVSENAAVEVKARKKETLQLSLREGEQAQWQASVQKFDIKVRLSFVADGAAAEEVEPETTVGDPSDPKRGGFIGGTFRAPSTGRLCLELDNSYSRLRAKDVQYVLQASIEAVEEVIQELTSDSGDRSDDEPSLVERLSVRSAGQERSRAITQLLAQRLSADSVHVKLKALFLIEQLVGAGSEHFKAEAAKSVINQHAKGLREFREEHPEHGTKPAEMIRGRATTVSQQLQGIMEIATPRGRGAELREVFDKQNLHVEEGELESWVEAIRSVSGQGAPLDASDDEADEEGGLRKLTERLSTAATIDGGGGDLLPPEAGEVDIQVKARKLVEVELDLKHGERLQWELQLDKYDVRCRAVFKYASPPEGVIGDKVPLFNGQAFLTGDPKNPDAGGKTTNEYTAARGDGTLTLFIDNKYSKMRAKRVRLTVTMTGAASEPLGCAIIHRGGQRYIGECTRPGAGAGGEPPAPAAAPEPEEGPEPEEEPEPEPEPE